VAIVQYLSLTLHRRCNPRRALSRLGVTQKGLRSVAEFLLNTFGDTKRQ